MSGKQAQPATTLNAKSLFLQLSEQQMSKLCFDECVKKKNNINTIDENCVQICQTKTINAYNFMLNVVVSGGVQRDSSTERMLGSF